jgi:hypothetical protein
MPHETVVAAAYAAAMPSLERGLPAFLRAGARVLGRVRRVRRVGGGVGRASRSGTLANRLKTSAVD